MKSIEETHPSLKGKTEWAEGCNYISDEAIQECTVDKEELRYLIKLLKMKASNDLNNPRYVLNILNQIENKMERNNETRN